MNVESTGREGALTSMFSRGGESDYNLVLIDGVRVNLSGGQFDFSRIGAGEIERVEVVRGAQSSLWGSDAMGSVVQVFTQARRRRATRRRSAGAVEGGSFNTWRGDAAPHRRRRGSGRLSGRRHLPRAPTARSPTSCPEDDRFEQTAFDARPRRRRSAPAPACAAACATADGLGPLRRPDHLWRTRHRRRLRHGRSFVARDARARARRALTGTATFNYFRYGTRSSDTIADPPFARSRSSRARRTRSSRTGRGSCA